MTAETTQAVVEYAERIGMTPNDAWQMLFNDTLSDGFRSGVISIFFIVIISVFVINFMYVFLRKREICDGYGVMSFIFLIISVLLFIGLCTSVLPNYASCKYSPEMVTYNKIIRFNEQNKKMDNYGNLY